MPNRKANTLDYTNSLTQGFNEQNKAFDTVNVNSLVPVRFGKVLLTYVLAGNGIGKIETAKYYSNGVYQETKVLVRGNVLGSAHKTIFNFINRAPSSLAGKALVIYDTIGAVKVWFNVDGANTPPAVAGTYRSIEIALNATDTSLVISQKTSTQISLDLYFIALFTSEYVVISSSTTGVKTNSYDFSTALTVKNIAGSNSQTLNNTYFLLNSASNSSAYYVWYNVNATGVDPLIAGRTGVMVAISTTYDSYQVASATKIALDATSQFLTNISGDTLTIVNTLIGASTYFQDNTAGFIILPSIDGTGRELLATIVLTYDASNCVSSVERL